MIAFIPMLTRMSTTKTDYREKAWTIIGFLNVVYTLDGGPWTCLEKVHEV